MLRACLRIHRLLLLYQKKSDFSIPLFAYDLKVREKDLNDHVKKVNSEKFRVKVEGGTESMNEEALALKATLRRANSFVREKKMNEAVQELKSVLRIDPKNFTGYFMLAQIYFASKRYDSSEKFCQQAIIINPKDVRPWVILGNIFIARQQYDLAISQLPLGIALDTNNYQLKYLLGYSFAKKKEYAKAKDYLEQALKIQPGNAQAQKALEVVERAIANPQP